MYSENTMRRRRMMAEPPVPGTRRRRRVPVGAVLGLLPLFFFLFLFFGVSYFVASEPDIEVQPGVGVASVDGRDLVLTPYDRSGAEGMFQGMFQDMFQVRLAAHDLATGELVWDTPLAGELIWTASVLAAGDRLAYVATDSGLVIVSLADGEIVARDSGIGGLGERYLATAGAYGYDAGLRVVVAMDSDGALWAIPSDGDTAAPASAEVTRAWTGRLDGEDTISSPPSATDDEAMVDGNTTLTLRDRAHGAPGATLVRGGTALGDEVFHDGEIVLGPGPEDETRPAAGAADGYVLVVHARTANDPDDVLSVVSLATGEVVDSLPLGGSVERALAAPDGGTVMAADDCLVVMDANGGLTRIDVGETNFFGAVTG